MIKLKNITLIILVLFFFTTNLFSAISERQLKNYGVKFIKKVVADNPEYSSKIRIILDGIIKNENSGIKIVDKFALFLYDSQKNGIFIKKTKFYMKGNRFIIYLVFKDKNNHLYTLFTEYKYIAYSKQCILLDIYFSSVFDEKLEDIEKFFKYR